MTKDEAIRHIQETVHTLEWAEKTVPGTNFQTHILALNVVTDAIKKGFTVDEQHAYGFSANFTVMAESSAEAEKKVQEMLKDTLFATFQSNK